MVYSHLRLHGHDVANRVDCLRFVELCSTCEKKTGFRPFYSRNTLHSPGSSKTLGIKLGTLHSESDEKEEDDPECNSKHGGLVASSRGGSEYRKLVSRNVYASLIPDSDSEEMGEGAAPPLKDHAAEQKHPAADLSAVAA